jgi:hypothetical protein
MGLTSPVAQSAEQFRGWTPVRISWTAGEAAVDWCYTAGVAFNDPFFDQTVQRCLRQPFRLLFRHRTPLETLAQVATGGDPLPLAGLLFHSSRCGSTLVSQMLGCLPSVLVLSEPGPLHSVLSPGTEGPAFPSEQQRVEWLRWTVGALGQRRSPEQRYLVIKLDAWAVLDLHLILRAFPGTPWVFLYREPVEVLVSQLGHRGYHMVPGTLSPAQLGLDGEDLAAMGPVEYPARVLAALLKAVAVNRAHLDPLLVNYRELPGAVAERIAPAFGLPVGNAGDRTRLDEVAGRDAKNPCLAFEDDHDAKHRAATGELLEAVEHWVAPHYGRLERARQAQL